MILESDSEDEGVDGDSNSDESVDFTRADRYNRGSKSAANQSGISQPGTNLRFSNQNKVSVVSSTNRMRKLVPLSTPQ